MQIVRRSAYAMGAQIVAVTMGLVTSILVSRQLGPHGRGVFALFGIVIQTALAFATFGVSFAFAYLVGKRRFPTSQIVGAAVSVSVLLWLLLSIAAVPSMPWLLRTALQGLSEWHYWLALATVPFAYCRLMFQNILLGEGRVEDISKIVALNSVLTTAALVIVLLFLKMSLGAAIVVYAVATGVHTAMLAGKTVAGSGLSFRNLGQVLREATAYGIRVYPGNMSSHFWLRADVYILNLFAGPTAVGHYTLATSLAEKVWMLEGTVMQAVLPDVISSTRERAAALVARTARSLLLFAGAFSILLGIAAPWLIPTLYGKQFQPAVLMLVLLLPGVTLLSVGRVFSSYYSGQLGRPLVVSAIAIVTAVASAGLYLVLVPSFGGLGAAVGSTLSYSLPLLIYLLRVPRDTSLSARELLLFGRSDVEACLHLLRRLRERIGYR